MKAQQGIWMSTVLKDMNDTKFVLGDRVARATKSGQAVNIKVSTVTRIDNDKLYLDESKVAVRFPGRLLIVTKLYE